MINIPEDTPFEEIRKTTQKWYDKTLEAMLLRGSALLLIFFVVYYVYRVEYVPLYTIESIKPVASVVKAGADLTFFYSMSLNKKCVYREVTQYLVDEKTNEATVLKVHFGDLGGGPTPLLNLRKTVSIPATLAAGKYFYAFTVEAVCGPFNHSDHFIYKNGLIEVKE